MLKLTSLTMCVLFACLTSAAQAAPSQVVTKVDPNFNGGACSTFMDGVVSSGNMLQGPFSCDDYDSRVSSGRGPGTVFQSVSDMYKKGFRVVSIHDNEAPDPSDASRKTLKWVSVVVERK